MISRFLKIILLILLTIIFQCINNNNINNNNNKIKVGICTMGKEENLYINEFVEYYKNLNVDTIFLYDNNDINGEKFEEKMAGYTKQGFVKILNWRGKKLAQSSIINDCYNKNKIYNWLLFFDLDEFLYINKEKNIKNFLNNKKFINCQVILINELIHTDNDKLFYENDLLKNRFPKTIKTSNYSQIKFIIRGNITISYLGRHLGNEKLKSCNGFGGEMKRKGISPLQPDYSHYYYDHFYSKSTEEFINKINKGNAYSNSKGHLMSKIRRYYLINNFTEKKIEMIEKKTKLNLTQYKLLLGYIERK